MLKNPSKLNVIGLSVAVGMFRLKKKNVSKG